MRRLKQFLCFPAIFFCLVVFDSADAQGIVGHDRLTPEMIQVLQNGKSMLVYSITPEETKKSPNYFGFELLGKTEVVNQSTRQMIGRYIVQTTSPNSVTYCHFEPHHGVAAVSGKHRVDYVICFHCKDILIYLDGDYWNHGVLFSKNSFLVKDLEQLLNKELVSHRIKQSADYNPLR